MEHISLWCGDSMKSPIIIICLDLSRLLIQPSVEEPRVWFSAKPPPPCTVLGFLSTKSLVVRTNVTPTQRSLCCPLLLAHGNEPTGRRRQMALPAEAIRRLILSSKFTQTRIVFRQILFDLCSKKGFNIIHYVMVADKISIRQSSSSS